MCPKRSNSGLTILELLVAAVITVGLAGGIFSIMSSAKNTVGLAAAKDEAKQMAEMALKQMQTDIAISHATLDKDNLVDGVPTVATTFTDDGGGKWSMKVPKTENASSMEDDYVDLTYLLEGTKLYRDGGIEARKKLVASRISKLEVFVLSPEQVSIEVETEVVPQGQKTSVKHNMKVLATIREAIAANVDNNWRTSDEVVSDY